MASDNRPKDEIEVLHEAENVLLKDSNITASVVARRVEHISRFPDASKQVISGHTAAITSGESKKKDPTIKFRSEYESQRSEIKLYQGSKNTTQKNSIVTVHVASDEDNGNIDCPAWPPTPIFSTSYPDSKILNESISPQVQYGKKLRRIILSLSRLVNAVKNVKTRAQISGQGVSTSILIQSPLSAVRTGVLVAAGHPHLSAASIALSSILGGLLFSATILILYTILVAHYVRLMRQVSPTGPPIPMITLNVLVISTPSIFIGASLLLGLQNTGHSIVK
ncbi:hypothetical protein NLJ89_g11160 [Agrocybe chaxingu]|uniref:Uncharacterized protein n=1 Tax=Agrocybe chaxingu TaxID=84603 RepID=A0A9W8JWT4_9AGAR|nr:hypothetical protein NLJ89_g11160 [Agrocybe chaxingu]